MGSLIRHIPNILTLGNLCCGSVAVFFIASGDSAGGGAGHPAVWLILVAAVLDLFDGALARTLGSDGAFGRELDSLADVVSFGLAPAAIAFQALSGGMAPAAHASGSAPSLLPYLSLLLVAGAAWRLARFNTGDGPAGSFRGMPSPSNGLIWASFALVTAETGYMPGHAAVVALVAVSAWLMVSGVRMIAFKFVHRRWKGNEWRYLYLLLAAPCIVAGWALTGACSAAMGLLVLLYLILSVISHFTQRPHDEEVQSRN